MGGGLGCFSEFMRETQMSVSQNGALQPFVDGGPKRKAFGNPLVSFGVEWRFLFSACTSNQFLKGTQGSAFGRETSRKGSPQGLKVAPKPQTTSLTEKRGIVVACGRISHSTLQWKASGRIGLRRNLRIERWLLLGGFASGGKEDH